MFVVFDTNYVKPRNAKLNYSKIQSEYGISYIILLLIQIMEKT